MAIELRERKPFLNFSIGRIPINKVVTTGHFTAFKWGELEIEAMQFTSILTFNSSGKIIKQVDWINYPSYLVDYNNRKNSNKWITNDN
jgi:hypothetical protein